jgi:hypothetical protein
MASLLRRALLRPFSFLAPQSMESNLMKKLSKRLLKEISDVATDKFLETLLAGMDLAFCLSGEYRRNIEGFMGRYLFRTADGAVAASAVFDSGNMRVRKDGIGDWNVRVTFRDAVGLKAFLFSKNQDILDSILRNDVEVDGNLNYLYKFGFMARELTKRLGIAT